jgi:flagellar basal-body rod protein FlgF
MSKPLWPALSGAIARDHQVEVISNNLANVNTNGFKRDDVSFKEYLVKNEKVEDGSLAVPHGRPTDKDMHPLDGRDQSFVIVNGTHTKFSSGGMRVTDNPLDMALDGPGFFEISTPNGVRYTRAGTFKMAADGNLVTTDGHPVLSADSQNGASADAAGRFINLSGREGMVHVNDSGEVYMNENKIAQLSVVEFGDLNNIRKVGSLNFENKNPQSNPPQAALKTNVKQGMVETSNVNPVQEISNLIRANRMFEQDLKAMKTVNEMLSKEVNDVGKF